MTFKTINKALLAGSASVLLALAGCSATPNNSQAPTEVIEGTSATTINKDGTKTTETEMSETLFKDASEETVNAETNPYTLSIVQIEKPKVSEKVLNDWAKKYAANPKYEYAIIQYAPLNNNQTEGVYGNADEVLVNVLISKEADGSYSHAAKTADTVVYEIGADGRLKRVTALLSDKDTGSTGSDTSTAGTGGSVSEAESTGDAFVEGASQEVSANTGASD